ncbi:Cbp1 family collagen-binding glycoprotein adhesin [Porphyromonas gulae]|uniref:Cbp1 family collagen-binding glycoprotein adhesin n=1 Tax=Porphyromonas gulae TaxID=111105 RepID=UPI00051D5CDF|nr:hypothetical protein [Porphyromonas gulae]KGL47109.1 hypothetical protein HQ49_09975 [Porphyromonas gulae]
MKKKLFIATALTLALVSCGKNSSAYKELKMQYDSIAAVNSQHESELAEMDSIISGILTNFQEISAMEGMINLNPLSGEIRASQRDRINDNMRLINEKLQANRKSIDDLTEKLQKSGRENSRLMKTLAQLRQQLEAKTQEVNQLREELERKNIAIDMLDSTVISQGAQLESSARENAALAEQNARQDRDLNTVRYCIGTSSDLKEMNIVRRGQVLTEGHNDSYFTKADLRNLKVIPLMAKKANVLTSHPASSYELIRGTDKMLTLRIKDPQAFWKNSKILVIQTN